MACKKLTVWKCGWTHKFPSFPPTQFQFLPSIPSNDNGGRRSGRKSRSAWKLWPVSRERKRGDLWPLLEFYLALKRGVVAQWGPSYRVSKKLIWNSEGSTWDLQTRNWLQGNVSGKPEGDRLLSTRAPSGNKLAHFD